MIEWLKNWTNSIIIAVIIAVIFELIIPYGNNKKYIKMIINLYVLFVILNPLISKFTKLSCIDINTNDYENYFKGKNAIETSASLDSTKLINSTVKKSLKDNIKNKLKEYGYNITSISINIDNENGQISKVKIIGVVKINNNKKLNKKIVDADKNLTINIENVEEINISNKNNNKQNIRKEDIQKIKKILSQEYEITQENIEIN